MYKCNVDNCPNKSHEENGMCPYCKNKFTQIQRCVFKIISPNTDKVFIGSTSKILKKSFDTHIRNAKKITDRINNNGYIRPNTSYDVIKFGDPQIEIIEQINATKKEILDREHYWIHNTPNCCNKPPIKKEINICSHDKCSMKTSKEYCGHHLYKCQHDGCKQRCRKDFCGQHTQKTIDYRKKYYINYNLTKANLK